MDTKIYDLSDRLINFGVLVITVSESYNRKREAGRHLAKQLVRSGTSPGIHYGEAQAAESRRDFIHKMKIILKELRETGCNIKMAERANISSSEVLSDATIECNELIAIFVKSIKTAKSNMT